MKPQTLFKQKIMVTMIASALGLTISNANSAVCNLVGTQSSANGATLMSTGPLNPVDGFPEFVTDSSGVSVQRCTNRALCFFDPIVPTDPFSLQIGSGGEAFYWGADAIINDSNGNLVLSLGLAAETAFLQTGLNGEPVNGTQFPFLRMRFVMGVPVDGTYTVKHPYGIDTFKVVGATGSRDVFSTIDRGFAPSQTGIQGPVGPFLKSVSAPAGYMGDTGVSAPVTGSPCSTSVGTGLTQKTVPWNYVEVSGVNLLGQAVDFGGGVKVLRTVNFNVQGKLYDGKVQTPLTPTRLSYSRPATGLTQIDTFATSTSTATVTATDGPTNPLGSMAFSDILDHSDINLIEAANSLSIPAAANALLPSIVQLTASDTPTDSTKLNLHLVDFVDISQADYDPLTQKLSVTAASSDKLKAPTLTLRDFGSFVAGVATKVVITAAPPAVVHVDSAVGGTDVAQVRVINAVAPNAPTSLALVKATSTTLTLSWTDNSADEQGFKVYQVNVGGTRTLKGTTAANVPQMIVTGLGANQAYTFQVDAYNTAGANSSTSATVNTLALPLAPNGVSTVLSGRNITVSWADITPTGQASFEIWRSTTVDGTYAKLASAPIGTTSVVDSTAKVDGTSYFYKVLAVRDQDLSALSVASTGVLVGAATITPPSNVAIQRTTATAAAVSWVDASTNETSFQVQSSTDGGTAWTNVGAATLANSTSATIVVTNATNALYRVNAINSSGTASSGSVLLNNTALPAAPSGFTATASQSTFLFIFKTNAIALAWSDVANNNVSYNIRRATNIGMTAGLNSATATANATSASQSGLATNTTYFYEIQAVSSAGVSAWVPLSVKTKP